MELISFNVGDRVVHDPLGPGVVTDVSNTVYCVEFDTAPPVEIGLGGTRAKVLINHLKPEILIVGPALLGLYDLEPLTKLCEEYKGFILGDNFHEDNDYKHYFYEMALEVFYGKDFFDWYRKVTQNKS